MKILVLSDSHASMQFMRRCVEKLNPDAIIHLGDYYDDAEALAEQYPHIPMHQVLGNNDSGRAPIHARQMLCYTVGGVMLYMTHGHNHNVYYGIEALVADARKYGAQAALYGHTHKPDCHYEPDGLLVLNPGSAGYGGRTAAILKTDGEKITSAYFITESDLEETV